MTAELYLPAERIETPRPLAEAPVESGFPIRAHHLSMYRNLLISFIGSPKFNINTFVDVYAAAHVKSIQKATTHQNVDYRKLYGRPSDDDTLPLNYPQDLMGNSPQAYMKRLKGVYLEFLTLPDSTPVSVGPVIDKLCESCYFHQGNGGGLHCQTVWMPEENNKAHKMRGIINNYLTNPDRSKAPFYPDYVDAQEVHVSAPLIAKTFGNGHKDTAEQFTVPLGLLRDAFVYDITREKFLKDETDTIHYSYPQLLQSR